MVSYLRSYNFRKAQGIIMKKIIVCISLLFVAFGIIADEGEVHQANTKRVRKNKRTLIKPKENQVTSTASSQKTLSHLNYQELKKNKEELVKKGNKTTAIKYLEKMVPLCTDLEELKGIMLELAQLFFETGVFDKAAKMYQEFTLLYPGAQEVELAMYQAIVANFKLILDAEHDQTKTLEAKELAETFLKRITFTTYKKEVEQILSQCEERLFESEVIAFNFYISRSNDTAAKKRLYGEKGIKETYLKKSIPNIQERVASLEETLKTIVKQEPSTAVAALETSDKDKKAFTERF